MIIALSIALPLLSVLPAYREDAPNARMLAKLRKVANFVFYSGVGRSDDVELLG